MTHVSAVQADRVEIVVFQTFEQERARAERTGDELRAVAIESISLVVAIKSL